MTDRRPLTLRSDTAPARLQEMPAGDLLPPDTLTNALAVVLQGLVTNNNAGITPADTVLQALGKLQAQASSKVDKDGSKVLSDNNYTNSERVKLANIGDSASNDRSKHTGTQTLSTISGAGTAASKNAQASAIDTSAGALMRVGAFGIGGYLDLRAGGAIDGTQAPSGFFGKGCLSGLADGTELGVGVSGYGVLTISAHWDDISARLAIRRRFESSEFCWVSWAQDTNTWTPWIQVNAPPVRGSNANGSYVRFSNGLQFCQHILAGQANIAAGSIYRSDSIPWTFPAPFLTGTTPKVYGDEVGGYGTCWTGLGNAATDIYQKSRTVYNWSPAAASSQISVSAWGYYK